jgi:hypothetical protein
MRPVTVLSSLAVLMLGSACATTNGGSAVSRRSSTQPAQRPASPSLGALGDSLIAQAIANREGPRVSIRAQLSNVADSRRVRGIFQLEDDAYVIVGHIDADGALRIAFPNDPSDDGFVRGGRSYQTNEFFAGFNAEYRFRARTSMYQYAGLSPDTYDGGIGYVFIIASWRPMRFDRFRTGDAWDSFEIADDSYLRDPRPAIQEFAALLAGDNSEAYTIQFARYFDTQTLYGGYTTMASAYSAGYCSGYEPLGFAFSPFNLSASSLFRGYGYGYGNFQYRGTNYYYDSAFDCYRTAPSFVGYGYRIVQGPGAPTPTRPRAFAVDGHRSPPTPQPLPGHFFPKSVEGAPGDQAALHSPEYRQRGLITEEASTGPVRRQPRVQGSTLGDERTRPSIQDMVNRRGENAHEGTVGGRSRMAPDNNGYDVQRQGGAQPTPRTRIEAPNGDEPRGYSRPEPRDNPRSEPARTEPSPRFQAPERASPPVRSEPAPRMQAPERTSPPPARTEPRSEPARVPPPERPSTPPPAASTAPRSEPPAVKPPTN